MFYLTRDEFEQDGYLMTDRNERTGAQAMIKCAQRTSGIMLGSRYHILIQEPATGGDDRKRYPYQARYHDLGRGGSPFEDDRKWLAKNGFTPWKKPPPDFIGRQATGTATYGGREVTGTITSYHAIDDTVWIKICDGEGSRCRDWKFIG